MSARPGLKNVESSLDFIIHMCHASAIRIIVDRAFFIYTAEKGTEVADMSKTKYKFTYDEVRVIVLALVELKNQLIEEGRYTDPIDELLVKFVD